MPKNEFELVEHNQLADVKLFFVDLAYRNLHMHSDFELCMIINGNIDVNVSREDFHFSDVDLFLFNPKQPHALRTLGDSRSLIISLQFSPRFCARYFPAVRNIEFEPVKLNQVLSDEDARDLRRDFIRLAFVYLEGKVHHELMTYALLNSIVYTLVSKIPWRLLSENEKVAKANRSERLNRILDDIEQHFTEKVLLSDIAARENLSMTYLSRFFKDTIGLTFQEFVSRRRLDEARSMIERTSLNLTDISLACGFSDSRYLAKVFLSQLGCSPADYRKRITVEQPMKLPLTIGAMQRIFDREESLQVLKSLVPTSYQRETADKKL